MPEAWPGARGEREGSEALSAWRRALARGFGATIANRFGGLPSRRLARALATYVRSRRQLNLFAEDDALAEERLDHLVEAHEKPTRPDGAAGRPPIG